MCRALRGIRVHSPPESALSTLHSEFKMVFSMKRMNEIITQKQNLSILLGLMLTLLVSACDTTNVATDQDITGSLDVPAATIIDGLDLSSSDAQQVADIMSKYDQQQPGRLWYVSAELQQTLSEDQKAALIASVDEDQTGVRRRRAGRQGERGVGKRGGFENLSNPLTDGQKEQLKAFREEHSASVKALIEQRRAGTLSEDDFKAQMQGAREAMREALADILTEEQLSELQERKETMQEKRGAGEDAEGEARIRGRRGNRSGDRGSANRGGLDRGDIQAAMVDALELSTEQQEQLKQVREELKAQMEELRGQFDRDNPEAAKESMQALHASAKEKQEAILTETQTEVVAIHKALSHEVRSTMKSKRQRNR